MNPELRETLRDRYRSASKFDAFVLEWFPDVYREFVAGTSRSDRERILAERALRGEG